MALSYEAVEIVAVMSRAVRRLRANLPATICNGRKNHFFG